MLDPKLEKIINDLQCVKKMNMYNEAIGLMHWDMRTKAPRKSMSYRSEVVGMLWRRKCSACLSPIRWGNG